MFVSKSENALKRILTQNQDNRMATNIMAMMNMISNSTIQIGRTVRNGSFSVWLLDELVVGWLAGEDVVDSEAFSVNADTLELSKECLTTSSHERNSFEGFVFSCSFKYKKDAIITSAPSRNITSVAAVRKFIKWAPRT